METEKFKYHVTLKQLMRICHCSFTVIRNFNIMTGIEYYKIGRAHYYDLRHVKHEFKIRDMFYWLLIQDKIDEIDKRC